jgi:hypothetical protein
MTRSRLTASLTAALVLLTMLLGGVLLGAPAASAASAPRATSPTASPVVFVGTGGLTWSDVSPTGTPALWSLLRTGATASLTVRSVHSNTCPVDGWLTLSAGERAGDRDTGSDTRPPCRALREPAADGAVPGWATYRRIAAGKDFDARIGLLGDALTRRVGCVRAVGPGAALAASTSAGRVTGYAPYDARTLHRTLSACRVTLVDVGAVRDPAEVDPRDEVRPSAPRAAQVRAVDARIGQVLAAAPRNADVLVGSLSDAGASERLRLAALRGPGVRPGTLESTSTRQDGLIQLADLTATILARAGLPDPAGVSGNPLRAIPADDTSGAAAADRLQHLVDYDQASHEVHALVPPFFNAWVIVQILIYAFVAVVWRRRWGSEDTRLRLLRLVRRVAIIAATVPVSTFLANLLPWWRFGSPMLAVVASVALFVAVISAVALLGPWRRSLFGPPAVVSAATMLILAADVMTGSRLQLSSLMGLQPVVGGRFYGMGNVTFALFATATIMLCIAVADHFVRAGRRSVAVGATIAIGVAGVIVDASPAWGSDFGGPPAFLPALAYFVLAVAGVRLTWRRILAIGGGTVLFLVALGVADWLRPPESRSHLGRFVQTAIDGGAATIILRKARQNWDILTSTTLTLLVPIGLVFVIYILARPTSWGSRALHRAYERAPLLRPGLVSLLVLFLIGFAANDSGTAIPAVGATLALPLVIAISVRTLLDETSSAETTTPAVPAPAREARPATRRTARRTAAPPA